MIRKWFSLLDQRVVILLMAMLIASPVLCGKNTYTICLIYSHYLAVYMNNVFLLMIYQWIARMNQLLLPVRIRVNEQTTYITAYLFLILISILYTSTIYISYYFFFGSIPVNDLGITVTFMIINMMITLIEATIIYLQIGHKKNFLYLALPIFINFLFHLVFTKLF